MLECSAQNKDGEINVNTDDSDSIGGDDVCDYQCQESGGCQVMYTGPPRGGNTFGSCFPSLFGGTCSGTPSECEDCNQIISCEDEGPDYEDYEAFESRNETMVDVLTMPDGEPCIYLCNDDGGCSVRYAGPPQSGSTVGNCFPSLFGGSCSGTPVGCRDCNEALSCRRKVNKDDNVTRPGLAEYCEISPTHTRCQFPIDEVNDRCGQVLTHKITDTIKQRLLDHHNQLRRKVAKEKSLINLLQLT